MVPKWDWYCISRFSKTSPYSLVTLLVLASTVINMTDRLQPSHMSQHALVNTMGVAVHFLSCCRCIRKQLSFSCLVEPMVVALASHLLVCQVREETCSEYWHTLPKYIIHVSRQPFHICVLMTGGSRTTMLILCRFFLLSSCTYVSRPEETLPDEFLIKGSSKTCVWSLQNANGQ